MSDLNDAEYIGFHEHGDNAIDHNLYVHDNFIFQANYEHGVRIFEQTDPANGVITEVGFIDTFPGSTRTRFNGAWSVFPFFDDGKFIISDIQRGLFVAQFDLLVGSDIEGDFDDNGEFDCADINALTTEIANGSTNMDFDLDGDGSVGMADLTQWLAIAGAENNPSGGAYLTGDADLNGVVDISDFNIWNSNKFTTTSDWCSANFSGDNIVDISDFNQWNSNKFSSSDSAASAVPEPSTGLLYGIGCLVLLCSRRKRK